MMKLSLQPTLLPSEKDSLRVWLIATLQHEKFEGERSFPLSGRLVLFEEGTAKIVHSGVWENSGTKLYLAGHPYSDESLVLSDRLAVLCALAQYCDDSVELREAMQKAITRYLLGEYQALSSNLVNSSVQPRGIAFSTTGGVASLFESGWITPSGESVDVSGGDWVVCASELQQPSSETGEPVVDINFNAGSFGPAFPPVEPEATTATFTVGQRVSLAPPNNDGSQNIGEGTIIRETLPGADMYQVHIDGTNDGAFELAYPSELEPLPTREFRVGDRVSYQSIPGVRGTGPSTGTVESVGDTISVRVDDPLNAGTWSFGPHRLTLIESETPTEWRVGDRCVFQSRSYGNGVAFGGNITELPTINSFYNITLDNGEANLWAYEHELSRPVVEELPL